MQITIVSGIVTFSVTVNTNDTIESVMHQIHEELGIPPEQQRFIVRAVARARFAKAWAGTVTGARARRGLTRHS